MSQCVLWEIDCNAIDLELPCWIHFTYFNNTVYRPLTASNHRWYPTLMCPVQTVLRASIDSCNIKRHELIRLYYCQPFLLSPPTPSFGVRWIMYKAFGAEPFSSYIVCRSKLLQRSFSLGVILHKNRKVHMMPDPCVGWASAVMVFTKFAWTIPIACTDNDVQSLYQFNDAVS